MDEISIWNRELGINEIRTNMCKKLAGSESGLVGYWRFDEITGFTCYDSSSNENNGTMTNMAPETDRVWSGAALGDESAFDYTGINPGDFSANLVHGDGDNITATGDGGAVTGIQVYRVDATALRQGATAPSGWTMDPLRYWGVFITGTNPTYTVSYDYDGHPGITNENDLGLASRDDNSDNSWADLSATLDVDVNTLTSSGQTRAEFSLGSKTGDNGLPVELTFLTANVWDKTVVLTWRTESETKNVGFIVMRSVSEAGDYWEISSYVYNHDLRGQFNSNTSHDYTFVDQNVEMGQTYWYKLIDVDINGIRTEHGPVSVYLGNDNVPSEFMVYPAYPNPFNPVTRIPFNLPSESRVSIKVFNVLGEEVCELINRTLVPGYHEIVWDGRNRNDRPVGSGTYIYQIIAQSVEGKQRYTQSKKMLLVH